MSWTNALPLMIVLSSLIPGLLVFALRDDQHRLRTTLNLAGVTAELAMVAVMSWGVSRGLEFRFQLPLVPGGALMLHGDALSMQFVALSSVLWMATTVYAIGYLEGSQLQGRFFGYFSICVSATVGVALAGNLVTFLLFYELLTFTTYPLVVHHGNRKALRAGAIYLAYTVGGGTLLLMGIALLHSLGGSPQFTPGGYLTELADEHDGALTLAFAMLVVGLGAKAALVPLHGWLPKAMVAPAPVSALLHAVAVVKAGAFGIIRVVYDVYGADTLVALNLTQPLLGVAAATIIFGSLRALQQHDLKRRLAYSTVSQISYIVLGAGLLGPVAAVGGLVHLVHQGVMKITLFFCAGIFAETLGIHRIAEMDGIGRRMPLTMGAFTVAALGMIGIPPTAGFISKWYLALGGLEVGHSWVVWLLVVSGLLNAAYFLPTIYRGWFATAPKSWPRECWTERRWETHWMLLLPPLFTAALTLLIGMLAGSPLSPLGWSEFIVEQEFPQ